MAQLWKKIKTGYLKLLFCYNITADFFSFLQLIWVTKKSKWIRQSDKKKYTPEVFSIQLNLISKNKRAVFIRAYDGDVMIFYEIFYTQMYKMPDAIFKNAEIIIDLGTNTGLSAIYFLDKAPLASLICLEPDRENFKILERNLVQDIKEGRVKILNQAIMNADGLVSFTETALRYNSHINISAGIPKNINAVSINTLLLQYKISQVDLLKIDIEGSEKFLFASDYNWLEKVRHIIIEIHSPEDYEAMMKALKEYGFTIECMGLQTGNDQLYFASKNY